MSHARSHAAQPRRALVDDITLPPGIPFYLAVGVAALVGVDALTASTFGSWMTALPLWGVLGLVWVIRFIAMLAGGVRPDLDGWIRWLGVPAIGLLLFLGSQTGALVQARFELSRAAFDQLADDLEAGRIVDHRGWVGAFEVGSAEAWNGSVRVEVGGVALSSAGFERVQDRSLTAEQLEARCECGYLDLGGGWFAFDESF